MNSSVHGRAHGAAVGGFRHAQRDHVLVPSWAFGDQAGQNVRHSVDATRREDIDGNHLWARVNKGQMYRTLL